MKGYLSIILALLMFVSFCAFPATADSGDTVDAVPIALPMDIDISQFVTPFSASSDIYCGPDHYSAPLETDYKVTTGKTKIVVESCTWSPQACDIIIGFFPSDPGASDVYGVRFSGGSISNKTIRSVNVPSGMYWIFVYNAGYTTITGKINYSVAY